MSSILLFRNFTNFPTVNTHRINQNVLLTKIRTYARNVKISKIYLQEKKQPIKNKYISTIYKDSKCFISFGQMSESEST